MVAVNPSCVCPLDIHDDSITQKKCHRFTIRRLPMRDPARVTVPVLRTRQSKLCLCAARAPREQRGASRAPLAPTRAQRPRGYTRSPIVAIDTHRGRRQQLQMCGSRARIHTLLRPDGPTARQIVSASSSNGSGPTTARSRSKKGGVGTTTGCERTHAPKEGLSFRPT